MATPRFPNVELPELVAADCPDCSGDGYVGQSHSAELQRCDTCDGYGKIDVCSGCGMVPDMKAGLEVCGCVDVALEAAA